MSEIPEFNERRHAEAPAEGEDPDADLTEPDVRIHSDEPAEGGPEEDGTGAHPPSP
jgi:hypothetical protein